MSLSRAGVAWLSASSLSSAPHQLGNACGHGCGSAVDRAIPRAYDFANRDEAAAAAREGRKPTRPPYKWSNESRAAKRKSRGA